MKKVVLALVFALSIFSAVGCGSGSPTGSNPTKKP